jgi:hypothetical protein
MIQIAPQMRILVAVEAVDFRRGIDGLSRVCRDQLASDPFSGTLFVFHNRRRTAIKILAYDGQGFLLTLNQRSSHYTSSCSMGATGDPLTAPWMTPRSMSGFHRRHCLIGGFGPGSSYRNAWLL